MLKSSSKTVRFTSIAEAGGRFAEGLAEGDMFWIHVSLKINKSSHPKTRFPVQERQKLTGIGRWSDFHICFGKALGIRLFGIKKISIYWKPSGILEKHWKSLQNRWKSIEIIESPDKINEKQWPIIENLWKSLINNCFFSLVFFQDSHFPALTLLGDTFSPNLTSFGASWPQFGGDWPPLASLSALLESSLELFGPPWGDLGNSCALFSLNFCASGCQFWKFGPSRPLPISLSS